VNTEDTSENTAENAAERAEAPVPPGRLRVVVTHLEMTARPARLPVRPPAEKLALLRAERPTVSFYRYLYNTVGGPWLWNERRRLDDSALAEIIWDERVEIFVLHVGGVPAGYIELDRRAGSGATRIAYFGMVPEFIGRRLGPYLLTWGIDRAWTGDTTRLLVNTCSLDHPKALGLYQRVGFVPVRQHVVIEDDPRATGLIPSEQRNLIR
jgi:GNAT superfamily N-acetyltransferase